MSTFTNGVNGLRFSNPFISNSSSVNATGSNVAGATGFPVDTLSTAPSNLAGQFFINGTHKFSPATKLTAAFSRGQNSQNAGYVTDATAVNTPATSLAGLVVTTHYDAKLTHQLNKAVTLSTGYRFNDRDNRTKVYQYDFMPVNQLTTGTVNHALNTPVSTRRTQYDVGADWKLDSLRSIRVAFEQDNYDRSCDNQAAYNNVGALSSGVQTPYYTAGYSCVQVPHSKESKESISYRSRTRDSLSYSVGYTHADKKSDVNGSYYNPMKADVEGLNVAGFLAYFQASRKQDTMKVSVNWQANDMLDLSVSGKYASDKYGDSTLGVQKGSAWSLNLDGTYAFSEESSVTGYYTLQRRQRDMMNANLTNQPWLNTLRDNDVTVGLSFKRGGLMQNKLKLIGDISTTNAISGYSTVNATATSTACATTAGTGGWNCGDTPDINTRLLRLKLGAEYALDKDSRFQLSAIHQRLKSDDAYYNFYQFNFNGTSNLPTGQQAGSYNVNVISMGFAHNF
jgi:MtrB/PioB family decaheme-associated outer membrane protein